MVERVLLASPRGYCAGVERAVETVEKALEHYGAPVYVRKQIVHNIHVVRDLEARGAIFVDEETEVPSGATVVYSAHGVAPTVHANSARLEHNVIDATCPLVTKVHVQARRYADDGYTVILIGHEGHEEVVGTMGEAPDATILVQDVAEAEALDLPADTRIAYITQTTLSVDETSEIIAVLRRRFPQVYAPRKEDICYATSNRQWAVKEMLAEIDLLLVLGSKNSSNSNRLVDVARASGVAGHLIDDETEIDERWLDGVRTVGISSGASAPGAPRHAAVRLVPGAWRRADRAVPDGQRGRHVQAAGGAAARADPRRDPALTVPAPTLAVVIPATDGPATLDRCLAAIAAAADPPDELVVVTTPPGAGPAAARNRGVAETTADIVLFVDSDVLVHPDVFDPGATGVRERSAPGRGLRLVRRRRRDREHGGGVPQPAPPRRPPALGG